VIGVLIKTTWDASSLVLSFVKNEVYGQEPGTIMNLELIEHQRRMELIDAEHRLRVEFAEAEHRRRMELIEAEKSLPDGTLRALAELMTPSNDQLRARIGKFQCPPGMFDDEEMPY
jgi:hypothetical protein